MDNQDKKNYTIKLSKFQIRHLRLCLPTLLHEMEFYRKGFTKKGKREIKDLYARLGIKWDNKNVYIRKDDLEPQTIAEQKQILIEQKRA